MGIKTEVITYSYAKGVYGEKVTRLKTLNYPFLRGFSFIMSSFSHLLRRKDLEVRDAVVNAHFALTSGFSASLARFFRDFPLLTTCHGSDIYLARNDIKYRRVMSLAFQRTDKVITVSNFLRKEITKMKLTKKKPLVIHGGVNRERFNEKISRKESKHRLKLNLNREYLLFIGGSREIKGLKFLLEAFNRIIYKYPKIDLLIVGRIRKDKLVKSHKERIKVLGVQPYENMPYVFRSSKAYISASLFEGFGLSVLEALASGVPVVSTKVGGVMEVTGSKTALLIPPRDSAAIYDACDEIISNKDLRKELIEKGVERSKQFPWSKTANETLKTMEEILRDGRS